MKKQHLWRGFLLVLILWLMLHYLVNPRIIPNPFMTVITMLKYMATGELLMHSFFSLYRLIVAVALALVLGVLLGVMMGMSEGVERLMAPFVYVLFPVPKAALLPIIFVFFGLGDMSKIILIYLILFFQITIAVYDATKGISKDVFLSARTLSLSNRQLYRHIIFPAILPNVLSALRVSVGIGIAVLFFAETYATSKGLGYFIMYHWSILNYEAMYSGILLLGCLGYVIFRGIDMLKARLVHWG